MRSWSRPVAATGLLLAGFFIGTFITNLTGKEQPPKAAPPHDAVADAQTPRPVPADRPAQRTTTHDRSHLFDPNVSAPLTPAIGDQPDSARALGFDFHRDPLAA